MQIEFKNLKIAITRMGNKLIVNKKKALLIPYEQPVFAELIIQTVKQNNSKQITIKQNNIRREYVHHQAIHNTKNVTDRTSSNY